jgi:hypothetical protein
MWSNEVYIYSTTVSITQSKKCRVPYNGRRGAVLGKSLHIKSDVFPAFPKQK